MAETNKDLEKAFNALVEKKRLYGKLWRYYDGDQPLVYNSERLREIFSGLDARFIQNWCAVVIDAVLDRIEMQVPRANNESADLLLDELWDSSLETDVLGVHEDVCVTGESFVIVWPNKDDPATIDVFHNDSRLVYVEYELDNPRQMRFAAKWWREIDRVRITLFYPDRLEYYASKKSTEDIVSANAFDPYVDEDSGESVVANPFGKIPVFHFRSSARKPKSQLSNILDIQDAINKLLSDMMIAAEFGASPQRYVISHAGLDETLKIAPNTIWDLPASLEGQGTTAGQFQASDLGNYLNAISSLSMFIGISTRTPRHYFFLQGGDPSGDALITMEAPLEKKVSRLTGSVQKTWREVVNFYMTLRGISVKSSDIVVDFDSFRTIQPGTQAAIRKTSKDTGVPLRTLLRIEGWDSADFKEMEDDIVADFELTQRIKEKESELALAQKDKENEFAVTQRDKYPKLFEQPEPKAPMAPKS